jgi:hypothetical protein
MLLIIYIFYIKGSIAGANCCKCIGGGNAHDHHPHGSTSHVTEGRQGHSGYSHPTTAYDIPGTSEASGSGGTRHNYGDELRCPCKQKMLNERKITLYGLKYFLLSQPHADGYFVRLFLILLKFGYVA